MVNMGDLELGVSGDADVSSVFEFLPLVYGFGLSG